MSTESAESFPTELALNGVCPLRGELRVPGDKSISHRALIFAAVAEGVSTLRGLGDGEDVRSTRHAIEQLGIGVSEGDDGAVVVQGAGWDGLREPDGVIDCGNSGTTIRMLAGVLAGRPFRAVLTGDASITRRPMARVVEPLMAMGAHIDGREQASLAPLSIRGGALRGMRHVIPVASAQVKSAILLAGLQASGTTTVVEPSKSRDHTERLLAALGAPITIGISGDGDGDGDAGPSEVSVQAGSLASFDLDVPGDPSSAAFFVVGALVTPGSEVEIVGVCLNPTRIAFLDVLRRMGADIDVTQTGESGGEPVGNLRVRHSALGPTVIEGDEIPLVIDEIPALAVAAAFADGVTEIRDAGELRVKESDRIGTIHHELSEAGIDVTPHPDGLTIRGGHPKATLFESHGDHRIAMAMAILANACEGESCVRGWGAIGSSYPGFAGDLRALGGRTPKGKQ